MSLTEREVADALVAIVCKCEPTKHRQGFPNCSTARAAANAVLRLVNRPKAEQGRVWWT